MTSAERIFNHFSHFDVPVVTCNASCYGEHSVKASVETRGGNPKDRRGRTVSVRKCKFERKAVYCFPETNRMHPRTNLSNIKP